MSAALQEADRCLPIETFQTMFRATPAPIALAIQGAAAPRLLVANDAFTEALGFRLTMVEGRRLQEVFRAAAGDQVTRAVQQCFADGEPARFRIAHVTNGAVAPIETEVRRIDVGGSLFVIISLEPISRRLTLAEMGEQGVLAEIGALSRGLVYVHNVVTRRFRYGDHPLAKRLSLTGDGVTDLNQIASLVHPDDMEMFCAHVAAQEVATDDAVQKTTLRFRDVSGEWRWTNIRSRVFTRGADGAVQRVIGVATDVSERYNQAAALAEAANTLAQAELNERRRIGRELHDSTAQQLVGARLSLANLERLVDLPAKAARALEEARAAIGGAQLEIRNFSYLLHPPSLQTDGLARTLRIFAAGFSRRTGLGISVKAPRDGERLPFAVEVALFRVAQEALMNVYRHAHARKARVRLSRLGDRVLLEIEDNGVGLPGAMRPALSLGVGVSGMQARMLQLGGSLDLEQRKAGVLVRAALTLTNQHEL